MIARTKTLLSGLVCGLLLSGLAACGEKPADAVQALAQAADTTVAASTARFAATLTMDLGGQHVTLDETGTLDLSGKEGELRLDASQLGLLGADGDIEARYVDHAMYIDMRSLLGSTGVDAGALLGGKRWMRMDLSQFEEGAAAINGNDPSSFTNSLHYLRAVDKDGIDDLGSAKVRGVETTHYRVDVDVATLREQLDDAKLSDAAREVMEQGLASFDDDTLHMDVWIDPDGRVRRQRFTMRMHVMGQAATARMSMELYDFGVPVHVEKPPADEVFDATGLANGAASQPAPADRNGPPGDG